MIAFDNLNSLDSSAFLPESQGITGSLSGLHDSFKLEMSSTETMLDGLPDALDNNVALTIGLDNPSLLMPFRLTILDLAKQALDGTPDFSGDSILSLRTLKEWNLNSQDYWRNLNQQAGYAAEIISTMKENILAIAEDTGITTYRADDRPDLNFSRNDQYVDKIRVNEAGEIVERIQTKFFGKNGAEWVSKMMSKGCEKYLDGIHVDKLECPRDFFEDAKAAISERLKDLNQQLEHVSAEGKTEAADGILHKIEKLTKIDEMIEQSLVSKDEARSARLHPIRYMMKFTAPAALDTAISEGLNNAAFAAALTCAVSSVDHVAEFLNNEITAPEMVTKIAAETGTATGLAAAAGFVTSGVSTLMQTSSSNLIRTVGGSCLPATVVSFAVESYDSVSDYAQGIIEGDELAHDLGENAAKLAGGAIAGAKVGALAGTVAGPVGTAAGSLVGGMVGTVIASNAYQTAVDVLPEAADAAASKVKECADATMQAVTDHFPEQIETTRTALNDYFTENNIPVRA